MICKSSLYNKLLCWWCLCCMALGCTHLPEGFSKIDDQVAKRLIAFGAGDLNVGEAAYVLIKWHNDKEASDTLEVWHEALVPAQDWEKIIPNSAIRRDIFALENGASVEYMAPAGAFGLVDFNGQSHFIFQVQQCFEDQRQAAGFLSTSAREGLRSEEECMDLFTVLFKDLKWVPVNDLWLGYKQQTEGDSIFANSKVVIQYHTFLLGGEQLDSLTLMEFPFGKSGQLLPAMQWGLAHLREGESAIILSPSKWAFGENGSVQSKIPPHTPIYWDVLVKEVSE